MLIHKDAEKIYDSIYGNNENKPDKDSWITGYVQGWTDGDMNGYQDAQREQREQRDSELEHD